MEISYFEKYIIEIWNLSSYLADNILCHQQYYNPDKNMQQQVYQQMNQ